MSNKKKAQGKQKKALTEKPSPVPEESKADQQPNPEPLKENAIVEDEAVLVPVEQPNEDLVQEVPEVEQLESSPPSKSERGEPGGEVTAVPDAGKKVVSVVSTVRDPRLPPVGSVIQRNYKGTTLQVTLLEVGFEFQGTTYSSLSKLAKEITGHQAINGFAFFKLGTSSGGKSTAARLQSKTLKVEKAVVRLRAALEEGFEALHQSEERLKELKEQASQSTTPTE